MISIVIDQAFLQALSHSARSEVLALLEEQIAELKKPLAETQWRADRDESYPLSVEEAQKLIQSLPKPMQDALQVFCRNYDGNVGRATLDELMSATGFSDHSDLSDATTAMTQSLRHITGNQDVWLLNWRPEDWDWSEAEQVYTRGEYFISGPAVESLKEAFGEIPVPTELAR